LHPDHVLPEFAMYICSDDNRDKSPEDTSIEGINQNYTLPCLPHSLIATQDVESKCLGHYFLRNEALPKDSKRGIPYSNNIYLI